MALRDQEVMQKHGKTSGRNRTSNESESQPGSFGGWGSASAHLDRDGHGIDSGDVSNGMGTRSNAGEEKRMYWEFWLISAVYAASVINVLFLVLG
ncbi:MAG: hypothetical protein KDE63_04000 [Novosphingobium sp.]|nr:hypothetical protein [Novosphingobium sp.]